MKGEKGVCSQCGKEEHGECNNPPHCANCGETHPAASKKCHKFLFEKEVQALRAREHLSFKEARQRVSSTYIRPGTTFAALFSKATPTNVKNSSFAVSTEDNSKSKSASSKIDSQDTSKTKPSNAKRKLSGDNEENPSSKIHLINSFNVLQDEMDVNSKSASAPPMSRVGPSFSACSVERAGTSVSSCSSERPESSLLACSLERAESFVSACSSEQVEICDLIPNIKTKSFESLQPVGQSGASLSVDTLELDSRVSASFGQAEQLPISITKTETEKEISTGARPKSAPDNSAQKKQENGNRKLKMINFNSSPKASNDKNKNSEFKKQENDNRKLKIPTKILSPKTSNSKNKKTDPFLRKTKGSSKAN